MRQETLFGVDVTDEVRVKCAEREIHKALLHRVAITLQKKCFGCELSDAIHESGVTVHNSVFVQGFLCGTQLGTQ